MNAVLFNLSSIILPILVISIFIFAFAMIFSPKLSAKMARKQLKSTKYMLDENEELLKELSTKSANVSKEGIEIRARAAKKGFAGDSIYCKHCGATIDSDSQFCKSCGKRQ